MKKIHQFVVNKIEEIEESKSVEVDGKTVTTTEKIKKEIPQTFFIRRPNRSLSDEARLFYASQCSKLVQKYDIIPAALLNKRFKDDKGALSEDEIKLLGELHVKFKEKNEEFTKLSIISKDNRTPEDIAKIDILTKELNGLISEIQKFRNNQETLLNETAEMIAREKLLTFYILFLAYKDGEKPVFEGDTYDKKLESYDKIEEMDDKFLNTVIKKFTFLIGYWFVNQDAEISKEAFDSALEIMEANG